MPVASPLDIHRILNENIGPFSSRRNYLIFAKNDIAKVPSADTGSFLSWLVACLLASWSQCLLPPRLTYTLVKRENPETRSRRSGRRHVKSYKTEIRLKIILPFRWYALHNATDSRGTLDSSRINPEMSRFYRYQFTIRPSTTTPRQVLRPRFGQLTQNGSYRPHPDCLLK